MIKIFSRCRILIKILIVIDVVIGIILAFNISELPDALKLDYNQFVVLIMAGFLLFLFMLITIIALKCIIKDADEDLIAVEKTIKEQIKT